MSRDLVVALSGGIGGAKLALGLSRIVEPRNLVVVANVGDDFEHLGLHISPDSDTLMYTLAGLDNAKLGWGRRDETWSFIETLAALGGEDWFRLGDRDLAVHLERTRRLRRARPSPPSPPTSAAASASARACCRRRMTGCGPGCGRTRDGSIFRIISSGSSAVPRCASSFSPARTRRALIRSCSRPSADERLRAVVICPSNPFISVEPILAVKGMRQALSACAAPVVAVSPIIGGRAVKGPTAKMMGNWE